MLQPRIARFQLPAVKSRGSSSQRVAMALCAGAGGRRRGPEAAPPQPLPCRLWWLRSHCQAELNSSFLCRGGEEESRGLHLWAVRVGLVRQPSTSHPLCDSHLEQQLGLNGYKGCLQGLHSSTGDGCDLPSVPGQQAVCKHTPAQRTFHLFLNRLVNPCPAAALSVTGRCTSSLSSCFHQGSRGRAAMHRNRGKRMETCMETAGLPGNR